MEYNFIILRQASTSICLGCWEKWGAVWSVQQQLDGQLSKCSSNHRTKDVVFIAAQKWEELLLTAGFHSFTQTERRICSPKFNYDGSLSVLITTESDDTFLAWLELFYICSLFYLSHPPFYGINKHMWSCLITFLHCPLTIRPRSTFFLGSSGHIFDTQQASLTSNLISVAAHTGKKCTVNSARAV